ncbi:MAG: hypothetical protein QY328_10785 [Anaerolineales bacterium]|nr:MAG: hypothetical protein QY328_10785 [Anaerolineales bacterium]
MTSKKTTRSTQPANYSTPSPSNVNDGSERSYHAYLLRVWREDDSLPWRAQLESPNTGDVLGFATLEELLSFLGGRFREGQEMPMG